MLSIMTVSSIFLRNLVFFFFSFIWVGTQSVIPQIFFLMHYPQSKNTLLASFLIVGTMFSIIGILASQHNWLRIFTSQKIIVILLFTAVILTSFSLFWVTHLMLYFAIFIVLKFASNYLYNFLDQSFVKTTAQSQMKIHVRSNLIYQLLGIMIAPFYFAFFYSNTLLNIGILGFIGLLSMFFAMKSVAEKTTFKQPSHKTSLQSGLGTREKLFLLYSFLVLTSVIVFTSFLIYFLKDYYQFENAETKGGFLIGVTSVVAIISVFIASFIQKPITNLSERKTVEATLFAPAIQLFIMMLFFIAIILFYMKLSLSFGYIFSLCIFTGIAYGLFLAFTRNYASLVSVNFNSPHLLSVYNNLPNYAALIGFGIVVLMSYVSKYFLFDLLAGILVVIMAILTVSFFCWLAMTLHLK